MSTDWYENHDKLECEQVFRCRNGDLVKLDRRVPGDGTKWYVATWYNGWGYWDDTIEPGDLLELVPDPDPNG